MQGRRDSFSSYSSYSYSYSSDESARKPFKSHNWARAFTIFASFLLPIVLFAAAFAILSYIFALSTLFKWFFLMLLWIPIIIIGVWFLKVYFYDGNRGGKSQWLLFVLITSIIMWTLGVCFGQYNYDENTSDWYSYYSANEYEGIDAGTDKSSSVSDAGIVYFTASSYIHSWYGMLYHSRTGYCVAPLGTNSSTTYSFWAVGEDCCSGNNVGFHCSKDISGAYDTSSKIGGLVVLDSSETEYYGYSTMQAGAAYGLTIPESVTYVKLYSDADGEVDDLLLYGYLAFAYFGAAAIVLQCGFTGLAAYKIK